MCCLFGILDYSNKENKELNNLINVLSREATVRGMDATGIAYNKDTVLKVYKKPKCAYDMDFEGLENCVCIIGHTRHTTQGNEKKNYNNHPFMGFCTNIKFALAHNGVLWNDKTLRRTYGITPNRIETDSYIAVQLLEHFGELNNVNISKMAELISGSFSFTICDNLDNLWLIKGDSPLTILHIPEEKLYIYASTKQILLAAVSQTKYCEYIYNKKFEIIPITDGDIFQIDKCGVIHKSYFNYVDSVCGYDWRSYGSYYDLWDDDYVDDVDESVVETRYKEDVIAVAQSFGITRKEINDLLAEGFTLEEIEDWLYLDSKVVS